MENFFPNNNMAPKAEPSKKASMESSNKMESIEGLESYYKAGQKISEENEKNFKENKWTKLGERFSRYLPLTGIVIPFKEAFSGRTIATDKELTQKQRVLLGCAALVRTIHWPVMLYGAGKFAMDGQQVQDAYATGVGFMLARLGDYLNMLAISEDGDEIKNAINSVKEFTERLNNTIKDDPESWDVALREQQNLQNLFPYKII